MRKAQDKEYVVVLDFIGNYDNNFMIPIALSGDRSYNKDNIRRYVMEGCRVIPGASTIHFDEISKDRIFKSIDRMKGIKAIIKKSYRDLKYRLGKIPMLMNCRRDLSSTMYGMKRINDDACIFVTYHKQEDTSGKEYLEGKPDYADEFVDNQIFMWDSQIGRGPKSGYVQEVLTAKRRRLFIKKSDSEGADFYYMGLFEVLK